MFILELKNVHKSFRSGFLGKPHRVLTGLDLSLESGEAFGFLGHNGAGKTTTIKLILGFLKPDSGSISLFGSNGASLESRARIGYLGENAGLYGYLDAEETLQLTGELLRMDQREIKRLKGRLLERVGLGDKGKVKVRRFSKGMRQRLGIATALMNDPELLLLDEPYTGLDPLGRKQLRDLLFSLKAEGKTIMMSSHIVPDVEAVCDRVGILKDGELVTCLDLRRSIPELEREIEVTVTGTNPVPVVNGLAGATLIRREKNYSLIRCFGEDVLKPLISDVYSRGGIIQEVRRVGMSLEDYFMEILGAGKEEGEGVAQTKPLSPEYSISDN